MSFIVAIDGTAGTGKGTISKLIAQELGLINIDTGITYRCVTLAVLENNIDIEQEDEIIKIANSINIEVEYDGVNQIVFLNGKNVTNEIRNKEVSSMVSQVSSIIKVREKMVEVQRKLAQGKDVIIEGRDITTVVFPNADVKIYMDADVEERARRRQKENEENGIKTTFEEVLENVKMRDKNDKNKPYGALKIVPEAKVIDTTNKTIEQVKQEVIELINEKRKNKC